MDEITDQQTAEKLKVLPREIRELLASPETLERIDVIRNKYEFSKVEGGLLTQVIGALLIGTLAPGDFVPALMDYLTITRERGLLIAQDVNHAIFNDVKDALRKVHASSNTTAAPSPTQAPTAKAAPVTKVAPLDPSLITCLPAQMSPEAARANKAPGNAAAGNIFEQKLGSAFRMKGESVSSVGIIPPEAATPVPLSPSAQRATPPLPPTPPTPPKPVFDPYRERPV